MTADENREADVEPGEEDAALLRRFAGGEREALGILAERHERDLLGLARGLVGAEFAVDAVQETWLRVIRHAGSFQGAGSVRTWLWRIAINRCRDLAGSRRRAARDAESGLLRMARRGEEEAALRGRVEEEEALRAALQRLSTDQRELLILCHHRAGGLRCASEVLGLPVGTVKSRAHAARAALRKELER